MPAVEKIGVGQRMVRTLDVVSTSFLFDVATANFTYISIKYFHSLEMTSRLDASAQWRWRACCGSTASCASHLYGVSAAVRLLQSRWSKIKRGEVERAADGTLHAGTRAIGARPPYIYTTWSSRGALLRRTRVIATA